MDWQFNESATIVHRYPAKYKSKSTSTVEECVTPFRVGEQFLIRAEARANLDNINGAKSDLNSVRTRAGLGNTPANDKISLIDAVLKERRVELFSEYGHRWLDLKRLDVIDNVMMAFAPAKGSTWLSYKKLLPIPNAEMENNPALDQNNGY